MSKLFACLENLSSLHSIEFMNFSYDVSHDPSVVQLTSFNYLMQCLTRLNVKRLGFNQFCLHMDSERHSLDLGLLESLVREKGLCLIGMKEVQLLSSEGSLQEVKKVGKLLSLFKDAFIKLDCY